QVAGAEDEAGEQPREAPALEAGRHRVRACARRRGAHGFPPRGAEATAMDHPGTRGDCATDIAQWHSTAARSGGLQGAGRGPGAVSAARAATEGTGWSAAGRLP